MRPILSILSLTLWFGMCLYLVTVGTLGAINGEPLGFLFLALGIVATVPYMKGFYYENDMGL
jgi:hypothetical protein